MRPDVAVYQSMKMVVLDNNNSSSSSNSNMETDTTTVSEQTPAKESLNRPTLQQQRPNTALKILNKGPGYIRERMMRRNAAVIRQNRKSAVELLEETKPYYVKSTFVRDQKQLPTGVENCYVSDIRSRKQAGVTAASSGTTAWPTQQQAGYTSRESCSSQLHTSKSTGSISSHTTIYRETTFPAQPGLEPEYSECNGRTCTCKFPSEAKQTVVGAKRLPWQRTSTSMEFSPTATPPLRTLVGSSDSGLGMSAQSGDTSGGGTAGTRVTIPQVRVAAGSAGSSHSGSIEDTCAHCQQHRLGLHSCRLSHHTGHNNISSDVMDGNRLKPHDTSSPSVRPKLPGLSEWRDARTDTSSDTGDHHSNNSVVKSDDQNVVRRRPKKSHVHRSRSDLTKRFSNSSDLSELSARFSRNSADLEKFFNEMGLDRSVLEPMLTAQCSHTSSNLHLYESASSIDSRDGQSWCSGDNDSTKHGPGIERPLPPTEVLKGAQGQTSIVERNARIIKWLCNVKRASLEENE